MNLFEVYYKDKNEFQNMRFSLDNIDRSLNEIGFEEKNLGRIVHVAGTNGKGSTSFFISQILEKHGCKTALFTSPHILNISERLNISSKSISLDDFDRLFKEYEHILRKNDLSFFEGVFLIAAMWFSSHKPDITILETGLGGRLDATNTNMINNKICVITSIARDHANILGNNVYKIADEKIKIIRPTSPVFLGINKESIKIHIKDNIKNKIHDPSLDIELIKFSKQNYPHPYWENYALANTVCKYILNETPDYDENLSLPQCRLEEVNDIILDGSHNPAGILALLKSKQIRNIKTIIFSSTKDRDTAVIFNILKKISDNIIFTTVPDNPRMVTQFTKGLSCKIILNPDEALTEAYKTKGKILITGSFFLCAYMKRKLQAEKS